MKKKVEEKLGNVENKLENWIFFFLKIEQKLRKSW